MSFYIPGAKSICNLSNGNVGINTINPQYSLDISGNINITGQFFNNGSTFTPASASSVTSGQSTQILFNYSGSSTGSQELTFNSNTNTLTIGSSGSIFYNSTGINFNSNLVPSNSTLTLGTLEFPWQSIYVSTGTVFIGPTGSILINSNGLVSSTQGFAAPYFQVGSINPGNGILLYEDNNKLYFNNGLSYSGPVCVFNISPDSTENIYYALDGNVGFGVTGPQEKIDVLGNIKSSDTIFAQNFTGSNLHISSIEANDSTLNIATVNGETNTVNIGTSNSIQTLNIGTVGSGVTTINLGGVGDTVNIAGNLVYVNSTITEISNPQFIINQSGTNINNTGLTVSQNGGPTGAYILVNSSSNAWTLKAGNGQLVTLNQDVSNGANVNFGTATLSGLTLNTDTISLGTNVSAQNNSVGIGYESLQLSTGPNIVAIGYQASQIGNIDGYSIALGYRAGQSNQSQSSIAIGLEAGQISQGNSSIAIGNTAGLSSQNNSAIAIGNSAGVYNQSNNSISIGNLVGYINQDSNCIAIGFGAGNSNQSNNSIAIGNSAGSIRQGLNCIAIGQNAGYSDQANNSIVLNSSTTTINPTTNGFFVNELRNQTGLNFIYYNPSSYEITYNTLNDLSLNSLSVSSLTGTNITSNTVTTNNINFDSVGSIYFQTGTSTGCFINGINYNSTGADHYVYYNNSTKELSQSSPVYFYSYSTGTQQIIAPSDSNIANFQPVTFNVNNILYHTFQHTQGSSVFTGTFTSPVTLQFSYSLQMHSTTNPSITAAAILNMDGSPIAGSYRSCTISNNTGEFPLNNTFLVNVPQGSHGFQLQVAGTSTTVYVGGTPNIAAPPNSYTSANLCCTRVI